MAAHHIGGKRNVVVLGKTGCGKSTLANKIICCDGTFKVSSSLDSCTSINIHASESVVIEGQTFTINMVDTVGFSDTTYTKKSVKESNQIMKDINKELKLRIPEGLNLIIFVFRHGRFTNEEHGIFKRLAGNFSDLIKELSMLVITGCDGKNDNARKDIVTEFRENPRTKPFADIMKKGIFCVGLPDIKDIDEEVIETTRRQMDIDMIPIHKVIADARLLYLQEQIGQSKFCKIM